MQSKKRVTRRQQNEANVDEPSALPLVSLGKVSRKDFAFAQAGDFKGTGLRSLLDLVDAGTPIRLKIGNRTRALAAPPTLFPNGGIGFPRVALSDFHADPYEAVRFAYFHQRTVAVGDGTIAFVLDPRRSTRWEQYCARLAGGQSASLGDGTLLLAAKVGEVSDCLRGIRGGVEGLQTLLRDFIGGLTRDEVLAFVAHSGNGTKVEPDR